MQITMFPHMYTTLFNHVTNAIKALEKGRSEEALEILIKAQQETEDIFCESLSEEYGKL